MGLIKRLFKRKNKVKDQQTEAQDNPNKFLPDNVMKYDKKIKKERLNDSMILYYHV